MVPPRSPMIRRLHLALGVHDIAAAVDDYCRRLGCPPEVHVIGEYALWRTPALNLSIRRCEPELAGRLRHLGWEDPAAESFSQDVDANGIVWERFSAEQQRQEIRELWPEALPDQEG